MSAPDPIATADLAARLEALIATIERETAQIRAGNLREGLAEAATKDAAARAYQEGLRTLAGRALPEGREKDNLRARHQDFEASLAENLAVLSTVRSVSESILRELAEQLSERRPSAYGPATRPAQAAPLALSRST